MERVFLCQTITDFIIDHRKTEKIVSNAIRQYIAIYHKIYRTFFILDLMASDKAFLVLKFGNILQRAVPNQERLNPYGLEAVL